MNRRWPGPWWAVLLTAAGVGIGVTAGLWQVGRAAEKRDLEARFAAGGSADVLQRLVGNEAAAEFRYRTVRLAGRYDPDHQLLLDNISHDRQPGYQVLTPFATAGGVVLVNRGWVRADGDRRILPDIRVASDPREVVGRIEWLPRPGIELAAVAPAPDAPWPRRLLFPTSEQASAQLGVPLPNYQLLLDPAAPDGYVREWRPGGMGPDRHLAYAVQWFGLALTVVVIYFVLMLRNGKQAS
ncbi:MAG: SURF1 family protein [Chromatiales bacterium]|nr:SURF1 family protein [Chromatiales bacterium]